MPTAACFSTWTRCNAWATHHREQMAAALTVLGQRCPELGMVYMLQEEIPT